ncbi:hypothetical protein GE09DRAFT_629805 [Coniochaeta sp. 2T2.1]|nr:hypothetical protein GE09DRAFT_629805 [Coniochaeta sp. 2T2.1]
METTFGWQIEEGTKFRRTDGSKHNDKDLAEFLQHLLFFGLLKKIATVMDVDFSCQSLVRRLEDGRLCLYTDPLNDFIVEWALAEQSKQREEFRIAEEDPSLSEIVKVVTQARLQIIDTFLGTANNLARLAFEQDPEDMGTWQLPEQDPGQEDPSFPRKWTQDPLNVTGHLIVMLGKVLVTAREQIYSPELRLESDKHSDSAEISAQARQYEREGALVEDYGGSDFFTFSCNFTIQAMIENRSCPSEIHMLHSTVEPSSLYFSTLLTRPRRKLDHKLCDNFSCASMQIDERTYQTKHLCDGGDCESISVDVTAVHAMLDAGQYPVIRVESDGEHGYVRLHVEPAVRKDYIAISHVWGHGLGNPSENGLPICQLRRLNRFTKLKLPDTDFGVSNLPIWIDTLCVPVERFWRRKALQLLHNVYSEAWVTIVLDEELLAVPAPDSKAEKAARILSSSWMRRLWTLEEALLGSIGLCYAFADRIVQHGEVAGYREPDCHPFEKAITRDLSGGIRRTISAMWSVKWEEGHRLLVLLQACCYRATSRPADELICLSSLLDLDVSQLWDVGTDEHERERAFYTMLGAETRLNSEDPGIPLHLLFMEGPHMCLPGFTWAPVSFLARPVSPILNTRIDVPPAYVREDGLHVTMTGYILDIPEHRSDPLTVWEDLWGRAFAFEDEANDVAYVVRPGNFSEYKSRPPPLNGRKVALLRQAELAPWALLTLVESVNDTIIVVRYLARCRAFDWSTGEFRKKVGIPMSWIGGSRRSAYASQIHLEPQALVEKALSTTNQSLTESGISVSQDEEWKVPTRLYPAELITKQTWKIV